jgi:hypothetical protein
MTAPTAPSAHHSHAEQWELQHGLEPGARAFAHETLPLLQGAKTTLIELGGLALTTSEPADLDRARTTAQRLVRLSERAIDVLTHTDTEGTGITARIGMTDALRQLALWGETVVAAGGHVSRECAAGLGQSYRQLRTAAEVLWRHELVPEGRTHVDTRRDQHG